MGIAKPSNAWNESFKLRERPARLNRAQLEQELRSEDQWREHRLSGSRKHWVSKKS